MDQYAEVLDEAELKKEYPLVMALLGRQKWNLKKAYRR